ARGRARPLGRPRSGHTAAAPGSVIPPRRETMIGRMAQMYRQCHRSRRITMPLSRVISADDHMDIWALPPKLFEERLAAGLRDRAPRVVQGEIGPVWVDGDKVLGPSGRPDPRLPGLFERAGISPEGNRPGTPALRLEDMDRDGIYAQVIYGPVRGFPVK